VDGDFRVGPWLVKPSLNSISRNGTTVHLEPKVMEVLVCLAEHPGEPLSKEKLLQSVWADTFVSDDVLIRSISELRRVFEDDAHESRFIQTIPKRGYRLVAPVVPVNGTSGDHSAASWAGEPAHGGVRWGGRTGRIGGLAVVGVVLLCGLLFALNAGGLRDRMLGKNDVPVIRSLAVLPLKNLSNDPAQKYFAYGMAEELIADLSQISTLKVTSHTSALRYENTDKPVPQIARELHVDAVVEGAVQRSGDRVHITAQLIYAPNDTHVWARTYDREVRDVLALQSDVAKEIANEIQLKMTPVEVAHLTRPRAVNPKALDVYWKGQYHLSVADNISKAKGQEKLSEDEFHQALASFQQAIELDPNYAPAYLGYSDAISESAYDVDPHTNLLASGRSALMKALELDDSLAKAHWALAERYFYEDWNWAAAEKEYKRALELEPNSAEAHYRYANYLDAMGRLEEGLKEHGLQLQLDSDLSDAFESPLTPLELQIERTRKRKVMATRGSVVNEQSWRLGVLLAHAGRYEEATDEWRTLMTRNEWTDIAEAIRRGYVTAGFHGALREWAKGLESAAKHRDIPPIMLVYIYGTLGENNRAFAWLEKAYEEREGSLPSGLKVDLAFDPIRSDPRFAEMVHRVGLPR
jgi:TolB-like protein/DNA-binding winged helix-turn-helix (wHTH) protein/thioredoxin-like negative regulator of GroEL